MSKVHYVNVYECGCCHFHIHCFHFFKCTYCFLTERRLVNASAAKTWIKLNINIYYYSAFPRPGHSRTWRAGCIAPRCHRHVSVPARKKPGPVFSYKLRYIVGLYENTGPGNIINLFTTIHDGNFHRHLSMNVTIKWHKFSSNIYYTSISGSWHALRPGSQRVKRHTILPQLCKKKCPPCSHFLAWNLPYTLPKLSYQILIYTWV